VDAGLEGTPQPLRLFLHIGVHKTGSTSLQLSFADNADALKREGVLYPLGRFPRLPYQHAGIRELLSPPRAGELQSLLRGIHEEAIASGCHTVILSGEDISALSTGSLSLLHDALLSAGFHPVVVVFFRPFLAYVRSIASQHMKVRGPFVTPARLAVRLRDFSESKIVDRFASVFGAQNVIRHDLSDDEDSVALFRQDIGLAAAHAAPRVNTGIDFATLSWLNAINLELDAPLNVPNRLYVEAFGTQQPSFAAEASFLEEVADAIGGAKGDLLKANLQQLREKGDDFRSIEAQIAYLDKFNRFVVSLRRYLKRRAARREARRRLANLPWLGPAIRRRLKRGAPAESSTNRRR
jgi:hypothetical protein